MVLLAYNGFIFEIFCGTLNIAYSVTNAIRLPQY